MQEQILLKLDSIEKRLVEQNLLQKEIFTFAEACLYLDLSSSHLYKLTSSNTIQYNSIPSYYYAQNREQLNLM
ncbi:MAG: hypothetical protein QM751_08615 [Paludibacteraceae bacterium]